MELKTPHIEALGFLLSWYRKDLEFFRAFQQFDKSGRDIELYCTDKPGSFQDFINSYQVARTLKKGQTQTLLGICLEWHDKQRWMDVSSLALQIHKREIVHGFPLSLASKVMFLMRPEELLPFDKRAKNALDIRDNKPDYKEYHRLALEFMEKNSVVIDESLSRFSGMLDLLEANFHGLAISFQNIRRMRLLDKLLWTSGAK